MASPPNLPISNSQTTTVESSQPPIATPAFRLFINHLTDTVRNGFAQRRPWSELVDRSSFSRPDSLSESISRARKNFTYFRVNYMTILAAVVAFSLITNPISLLVLGGLLAAWVFLYLFRPSDPPLVLFGRTFTDRETLGLLSVSSVVVVFLTSVGSLLISSVLIGLGIVFAHGAMRVPEDLFLDEPEQTNVGFLSILGLGGFNSASNPAPPPPTVTGRV
ncbi:hypothetical protein MKW98_027239 [Papaver atlanticum]|uniref:PRA1 family protein n=1 Tax=Papaver atlanticum TaxID=357466 RepID=A0AAD4XHC9_9MAGN|nr:hypothetical protein MKW98_027239 [Papaver atlanticum]